MAIGALLKLQDMGSAAIDLLEDLIDGKEVPFKTCLPGELLVRESCGCFNPSKDILSINANIVIDTSLDYKNECKFFHHKLIENKADIISHTLNQFRIHDNDINQFNYNLDELIKEADSFLYKQKNNRKK